MRTKAPSRLVVKVGSSIVTGGSGHPDRARIKRLTDQIASLKGRGAEVVLVSSGAIAAGLGELGIPKRPTDMASLQAAAAVGQIKLMDIYSEAFGSTELSVAQVLLTRHDMVHRSQYVNARRTLERLQKLGVVPIVNENDTVATDEIRYGDNDLLAALAANIVNAELLILLSDVEGMHSGDPRRGDPELISEIEEITPELVKAASKGKSASGSGGMASKLEAARVATMSGVGVVIASGDREGVLIDIYEGKQVGTFVKHRHRKLAARKLWIAWAPTSQGRLVVDDGAAKAITEDSASLLAAGIESVTGRFAAGDAVEVSGPDGSIIAKGLISFDSDFVQGALGKSGMGEVIHRDHMVVL